MNENSLETLSHKNKNNAYQLTLNVSELKAIHGALDKLTEDVDNIVWNKWYEDRDTAFIALSEIQDTVRLISMAYRPLFKEVSNVVTELNINSQELHDTVVKIRFKSKF